MADDNGAVLARRGKGRVFIAAERVERQFAQVNSTTWSRYGREAVATCGGAGSQLQVAPHASTHSDRGALHRPMVTAVTQRACTDVR
jgi:hypothetical protein